MTAKQLLENSVFSKFNISKIKENISSKIAFEEFLKKNFTQSDFRKTKKDPLPFVNLIDEKKQKV